MAAAAVVGLAGAGVASAVTIGSDLSVSPAIGFVSGYSGTQLVVPDGAPNAIASPINGVLVHLRQRYGRTDANPGSLGFRILSGNNPFTARPATVDGNELRFPMLARLPAGSDSFIDYQPIDANGRPIGIPIAAGERLGLAQITPGVANVAASSTTGTVGYTPSQHLSGTAAYTSVGGYEISLQGVVEPDADGDHRGDLTQDQCPTVPNDPATGLCPPQLVTREVTREVQVQVQVEVQKCHVPLLRGLTRSFASRLLTASSCALGQTKTKTVRRGPRGRVVGQSAGAGAVLAQGAKVDITLSKRAVARRHRR